MYDIAADIGGTTTDICLARDGDILEETVKVYDTGTPLDDSGLKEIFYRYKRSVGDKRIDNVGISCTGFVDYEEGELVGGISHDPMSLDWVENEFGSLHISNDVDAALIGQEFDLDQYKNAINIVVGTGIGGAVKYGGEILWSDQKGGHEIGFIEVDENEWDHYCGGGSLDERFGSSEDVYAGKSGDLSEVREMNKRGISSVFSVYAPEMVSFSGSVATNNPDLFRGCAEAAAADHPAIRTEPDIHIADPEENVSLRGAAALAQREIP